MEENIVEEKMGIQVVQSSEDNGLKEDGREPVSSFPSKPEEKPKDNSIKRSLSSFVFFILISQLVFKWEFTYTLIIVGVILIHELGHFAAMRYFRYSDTSIFFVPLVGALASGKKAQVSQKQEIIVTLAGPLPGIIIGSILAGVGALTENEYINSLAYPFLFINLFNLLPIMPLDGGRVIKSLFFEGSKFIRGIFMCISMILIAYYCVYYRSYFLLIIPFFMLMRIFAYPTISSVREEAKEKGINLDCTYEELSDEGYWIIRDAIGTHMQYYKRIITPGQHTFSDKEEKIMKQVQSIIQKKPVNDLSVLNKVFITILWLSSFILPLVIVVVYSFFDAMFESIF